MRYTGAHSLLAAIQGSGTPPLILVGGNNDYLIEQTFAAIRDAITTRHAGLTIEAFPETADLALVIDSFRTHSLFGGPRLLLVPEVNAFVTRKELDALLAKAVDDWSSAKTDRKRSSSVSKLLHILGLVGADLNEPDEVLIDVIGAGRHTEVVKQMLQQARSSGGRSTRGEADAALLSEAAARGGAPQTTLLMRTGEIPEDSSTVRSIEKAGAVVVCDLSREAFPRAVDEALEQISREAGVRFEAAAVSQLRKQLGFDRVLSDKFSKEIPDLRLILSEAESLATLAGSGGRVTAAMVEGEVSQVTGGVRYEFASLFSEGKFIEALQKLRDLVTQARREDPKVPVDIQYGRFLFVLADELRQLIGIRSFAAIHQLDLTRPPQYNRFRDQYADSLSDFLKKRGLVRQKPHPFALHKKLLAAKGASGAELFAMLATLAEIDFSRKSGGLSAEAGLETLILSQARATRR